MLKKKISNEEKVKFVVRSFQKDVVITKFCIEHAIPRSTFYRWKKLVIASLASAMPTHKKKQRRDSASRAHKTDTAYKQPGYSGRIK